MQRPCFALAILLGSMMSSMVLVGTAKSQSLAVAVIELPGPASLTDMVETSSIRLVLGQSVDCEDNGWSVENGGADRLASDDDPSREVDSSLAALANLWSTLIRTSYQIAHDYAMCGNRYFAGPEFHCDYEELVPVSEPAAYFAEGADNIDSASDVPCEDYNYCLGDELDCGLTEQSQEQTVTGWENCEEYNYCLGEGPACELTEQSQEQSEAGWENCEDYNYCVGQPTQEVTSGKELFSNTIIDESLVVPQDNSHSTWLWDEIWNMGASVNDQLKQWWAIAQDHPWVEGLRVQLSTYNTEPNFDDLFGQTTRTIPAVTTVSDFQEEVLLITAADSLDRLSMQLQEVAEHLRTWAADRIVLKSNSRRIATKPAN